MEYSVQDLIKILFKKWYVIVIAAVLIGCGSMYLSQVSYQKTCEEYERLTSETVPVIVDVGTLVATYSCEYAVQTDILSDLFSMYITQNQNAKTDAMQVPSETELSQMMVQVFQQQVSQMATSDSLYVELQSEVDILKLQEPPTIDANKQVTPSTGPLQIAQHFSVEIIDGNMIKLTVSGLEQSVANQILDTYCQIFEKSNCNNMITVTLHQDTCEFTPNPLQPTTTALLAQTVMKEPTPPNKVKVAGTASVFGAVLACFCILIVTFIKDTRASGKAM